MRKARIHMLQIVDQDELNVKITYHDIRYLALDPLLEVLQMTKATSLHCLRLENGPSTLSKFSIWNVGLNSPYFHCPKILKIYCESVKFLSQVVRVLSKFHEKFSLKITLVHNPCPYFKIKKSSLILNSFHTYKSEHLKILKAWPSNWTPSNKILALLPNFNLFP